MILGISYQKFTCMVLLFLVIVISLVLSNVPFLISNQKASMVGMEGMDPNISAIDSSSTMTPFPSANMPLSVNVAPSSIPLSSMSSPSSISSVSPSTMISTTPSNSSSDLSYGNKTTQLSGSTYSPV